MKIDWKSLHKLPVRTVQGKSLGYVSGVTVQTDGHVISKYEISNKKGVFSFLTNTFLVSPSQVVSISANEMVVDEAVVYEAEKKQSSKRRLAFSSPAQEIELSESD